MKTYEITSESGNAFAFEVENAYISVGKIRNLLINLDHVSNFTTRKPLSIDDEFRASFNYRGLDFIIIEPFGDSSRYWIGLEKERCEEAPQKIKQLEQIFIDYQPPFIIKLIADIITLKFIKKPS